MENKGSKTKVAKGGKAKKISKKVVESDVSDSLSDMSSSVSPLELEPQVKVTKKTAKAKKATKVDKSDCPVECCVEDEAKKTKATKSKAKKAKDCEAECCEEEKPKKTKAKKVKDPNAPKKELNPIMKEMNKFRNEVIGPVVGSKAPKLTIPPFKLAMAAARAEMGLGEKDKNTVETVQKAVELFQNDNSKYLEN
jgi:hypothetical protein